MIRRRSRTGGIRPKQTGLRQIGRGPVRNKPTRSGDSPKRPKLPTRVRAGKSSFGTGRVTDAQKKAMQATLRGKLEQVKRRRSNTTPEQNARFKQAAELFKRRRAAGKGRTNRSPDGKLGLLSGRMGSGKRPARPTQRMTAQQRSRLAAQRRAAQARGRGSRGRNLARRLTSRMGPRTLRRR